MYTREQLKTRFSVPPECTTLPQLTDSHLDTLEAIQAAGADHGRQGFYPDGDFSSDADWCYGIGELINRLETELEIDDGSVFELYSEAHSESFQDGTINPEDRNSYSRDSIWDFQFGAYGDTKVSVHAPSLDDALELAADWLADNAPGHLITHGSDEARELWVEACQELGRDPNGFEPQVDSDGKVYDLATQDLTYTKAGFIRSWEWYVNER